MNGLGGTLDRYVLVRMATIYALCIGSFILLFLVVDGFSRLDEFIAASKVLEEKGTSVWAVAGKFYLTKTPRIVSVVGPYVTLFAGIATLLSLARTNELVPMITAGRSAHRVLLPVYVFAAVVACTLVYFEEHVVPAAIRENSYLDRIVRDQGKVEMSKIPHLTDDGNRFSVGRWYPTEAKLTQVVCQRYSDRSGRLPVGALAVAELYYRKHPQTGQIGWYPRDGRLLPESLGADGRVLPLMHLPADVPIAFNFTPQDIGVLASSSEEGIERAKLIELQRRFPGQPRWAMDLHARTTRPISSFVLLLLGIPFVASPEKRSVAWGLGLALLLCVVYFFVEWVFRYLGARSELGVNPAWAMWAPPILFTALAGALMDRVVT